MVGARCCFECWPGGPVTPPPCRRCGSTSDYYASGLCRRCHLRAPQRLDSCRDCLAWGASRTHKWRCKSCEHWQTTYAVARCETCSRWVPVHREGGCRLCRRQRAMELRRGGSVGLAEANRNGQQLFFADMVRAARDATRPRRGQARAPFAPILPVAHRQLVLFEVPLDLRAGRRRGFAQPRDPALAASLHAFVADHAARHGWSRGTTERAQRGVRILLGTQHTPGAPIRESDGMALSQIKISARGVADLLAEAGMLEEDRVPAIVRWFEVQIAEFSEEMRRELGVWFDVGRNGSSTPPRFRPRSDQTIKSQLRFALPALRVWARSHTSLREISREDVRAVLPPSGSPRSTMLQGLRSIFRVLKARQLVFVNPTARMSVPKPDRPAPVAADLTALRQALDSDDPARAALAALLAFHAVRVWQLCELELTDVRDSRLHIGEQVILLADPVRARLGTYLAHRAARWPSTANPHLFVHDRNALGTRPPTPWWIRKRLGMSAQTIRQDRILDEAHATRGDIRRVCDLFGLSVAGAYRYTATVDKLSRDGDTDAMSTPT